MSKIAKIHLEKAGYEFSSLNPIKYSRLKIIGASEKKLQTLIGRNEREKKEKRKKKERKKKSKEGKEERKRERKEGRG